MKATEAGDHLGARLDDGLGIALLLFVVAG
jgi:hypothetical protein